MKKSLVIFLSIVVVLAVGYFACGNAILQACFPKNYILASAQRSAKQINKEIGVGDEDYTMDFNVALNYFGISIDTVTKYDKKSNVTLVEVGVNYGDDRLLDGEVVFNNNGIGFALAELYDGYYDLDLKINTADAMEKDIIKASKKLWKSATILEKEKSTIAIGDSEKKSMVYTVEVSAEALNLYMEEVYAAVGEELGEVEKAEEGIVAKITIAGNKVVKISDKEESFAMAATEKRMADNISITVENGEASAVKFAEKNSDGKVPFEIISGDGSGLLTFSGAIIAESNDLSDKKSVTINSGYPNLADEALSSLQSKLLPLIYSLYGGF